MTQPPPVVKAATAADLLRLVPALAGVDVADSLVLVLFTGTRTAGALRIDLPGSTGSGELAQWASTVVGLACRADAATGVIPVAYTSRTFAPSGRIPEREALRAVARRSRQAGLQVKDVLCVAADAWGSLNDPALPNGGRPLAEIEPVLLEGSPQIRRLPQPIDASDAARDAFAEHLIDWWVEPEGPGGTLHGVDLRRPGTAFRRRGRGDPAMERYRHGGDQAQVVALVERMLDPHDPATPCPCRALLFAIASRPGLPNLILLQFGFGAEFGTRIWAAAHGGDPDSPDIALVFAALRGDHRRPDPERLRRGIEVLLETEALLPEGDRAPVTAMLAWLHWACGSGRIAGALAERALSEDPEQELALLVLALTSRGELPAWAFNEDPTADPFALPAA